MKIIAIGDSLALPGHLNSYEQTWYYKLKLAFPTVDFNSVFRRAVTTAILVTEGGGDAGVDPVPLGADCLEFYKPHVVILQLGIVDCAPRLFRRGGFESRVLSHLPAKLRKLYITFVRKTRRRDESRAYVPADVFERNIRAYLVRCKNQKVRRIIIIGIPYPDERMILSSPRIADSVELYNSIFVRVSHEFGNVDVVFPLDARKWKQGIFEDGYHPNRFGHQLVFRSVASKLRDVKTN